MRVLGLPLVAKLRDRPLLPGRHEDRVVAEALAAGGLVGDPALQDARATRLLAPRRQRDELADVSRQAPVAVDAVELRAQSPNRPPGAPPPNRAERMPGPPPRPSTSMPESSPSTQPPSTNRSP